MNQYSLKATVTVGIVSLITACGDGGSTEPSGDVTNAAIAHRIGEPEDTSGNLITANTPHPKFTFGIIASDDSAQQSSLQQSPSSQ